jgi:hypothetical protein
VKVFWIIFDLVLISILYWTAGLVFLFITILPCGMGPEADCDMPSDATIWSAIIGVFLVYAAICLFLGRRWLAR